MLNAPDRVPSVGTLYQPVPVIFVPATPAGISMSFTSTFNTPCISPRPSSTSIRVRLPSLRANTTGGLYHAVPYTTGTKSLYRAELSHRGRVIILVAARPHLDRRRYELQAAEVRKHSARRAIAACEPATRIRRAADQRALAPRNPR